MTRNTPNSFSPRYLESPIREDLGRKMVFIGGPRQVGKTTLALNLLGESEESKSYLNWDDIADREKILKREIRSDSSLIIFDEIHKFADWRGLLKGLYDTRKSKQSFLVTGSARLDYYRKGGDSLQGRYHYYRLHPISLGESISSKLGLTAGDLIQFGGFPEPLSLQDERSARRWRRERRERVLREDLRDLENVREVSKLELLVTHLPECVGSPLSIDALRKLLQVSHESVARWITIFENLYLCFRISPYGSKKIRAVKKEQKLYFWDWAAISSSGSRFENLVACQLLKFCHFREDTEGHDMELRFLRDTDGREVDFVVLQDGEPLFAVECKTGEARRSSSISYFLERTPIPKWYQVHLGNKDYGEPSTEGRVLPFAQFCKELNMP
ncbi:MAG: ATP-binding protein [Bdellovibrionales bacterium]|nr:ATP-binding protein [Bdellovibrionales bacterium]